MHPTGVGPVRSGTAAGTGSAGSFAEVPGLSRGLRARLGSYIGFYVGSMWLSRLQSATAESMV